MIHTVTAVSVAGLVRALIARSEQRGAAAVVGALAVFLDLRVA